MHRAVSLLALAVFACADPAAGNAPDASSISMESVCLEGFDTCLATGADPARCENQLASCMAAVDAMAAACDADLQTCLASGRDPAICEQVWATCTDDLRPDGTAPQPMPPEADCELQLDQCVQSGVDPERCHLAYEDCVNTSYPPRPQPGTEEGCHILFGTCLDLGLPEDFCGHQLDVCLDVHAPPPCDALFATCVDLGLDPRYCEQQRHECLTLGGPGTDPGDCWEATGAPCEEPTPVDEDCLTPDGTPCEDPAPPANTCEDELDRCLRAGNDPASCDRRYQACIAP